MDSYGKELILDIHDCKSLPMNREDLTKFLKELCGLIDMERGDLHFWDYEGFPEEYNEAPPHLKGATLVQFIQTSNITIHTLDDLKKVYLNLFSCKKFDVDKVVRFSVANFKGEIKTKVVVDRQ